MPEGQPGCAGALVPPPERGVLRHGWQDLKDLRGFLSGALTRVPEGQQGCAGGPIPPPERGVLGHAGRGRPAVDPHRQRAHALAVEQGDGGAREARHVALREARRQAVCYLVL